MEKNHKKQQLISELMDSELDAELLPPVMSSLYHASGREQWDIYHQIGDVLRSEEMAHLVTKHFNERLAIQLASEPSFIAPTKRLGIHTFSKWPAAAAAAVAVLTGFLIAPALFHRSVETNISASLSIPAAAVEFSVADKQLSSVDPRELQSYILWHHSSTPSLYGLRAIAHPASPSRQ